MGIHERQAGQNLAKQKGFDEIVKQGMSEEAANAVPTWSEAPLNPDVANRMPNPGLTKQEQEKLAGGSGK